MLESSDSARESRPLLVTCMSPRAIADRYCVRLPQFTRFCAALLNPAAQLEGDRQRLHQGTSLVADAVLRRGLSMALCSWTDVQDGCTMPHRMAPPRDMVAPQDTSAEDASVSPAVSETRQCGVQQDRRGRDLVRCASNGAAGQPAG